MRAAGLEDSADEPTLCMTLNCMHFDPHELIPPPTSTLVDPYVQRWVAGTNGHLYVPLINKLSHYPIPTWPGSAASGGDLLLDIGCGWGRWLVSAGQAGYIPIGLDLKTDALQAARRGLKKHNLRGYVVATDLRALPFREELFDRVFSIAFCSTRIGTDASRACSKSARVGFGRFLFA